MCRLKVSYAEGGYGICSLVHGIHMQKCAKDRSVFAAKVLPPILGYPLVEDICETRNSSMD